MTAPRWADRAAHAAALREAALRAVDPAAAVRRFLTRDGDTLRAGERTYALRPGRVFAAGCGKAAAPMLAALIDLAGPDLAGALAVTKYGHTAPGLPLREAGHPVPDAAGVQATREICALLASAGAGDLVLVALSGGGSALLTWPVDGVTLADLQALTGALLRSGATIDEINAVRKHLDRVKGGGLARIAAERGAQVVAVILSDVVGDPLDVIASGPAAPDRTTFADALSVLARYDLLAAVPAVTAALEAGARGARPDTPKPGDPLFARVQNVIVGSNALAAEAAAAEARTLGFETLLLTTHLEGEAREVARVAAALARESIRRGRPLTPPACLVLGGETTVTLRGRGRGGRNQELALAAAIALDGLPGAQLMALATDGNDGPTDAAGALVSGETAARARALGLDPRAYLAENDAYGFFSRTGELIVTGPTNTNVNDLLMIMTYT